LKVVKSNIDSVSTGACFSAPNAAVTFSEREMEEGSAVIKLL